MKSKRPGYKRTAYEYTLNTPKAKITKSKKDQVAKANHDVLMDSQNISDNIDQSIIVDIPESTRLQVCDSPSGHQPLTSTTIKPCHHRVSLRLAESIKDITSTHSPAAKRLKQKVDNETIDLSSFVQSDTTKYNEPNTVQHDSSKPLSTRHHTQTQQNECLVVEKNSISKTATTQKSTRKKGKRITPRFTTKRKPPVDRPISKCIKNTNDTTIPNVPVCDNVQSATLNIVQVAPGFTIPPLSNVTTESHHVTLESTENPHMEPITQNGSETDNSDIMNTLLKKRQKRSITRKTTDSRPSKQTACIGSPSITPDDTMTVVQNAVCNNVERIQPNNTLIKSTMVKEKSVIQQESTDLPSLTLTRSISNNITAVEYDLCPVTQKSAVCKKEKSTKKKRKRITPRFLTSKKTTSPLIVSPTEELIISPTEAITQSDNQLELSDGNMYTGQQEKEQEEPNNNPASAGIENYDANNNNNDHDDQSIQQSPARRIQRKKVGNPPDESIQPLPARRIQRKKASNLPVERVTYELWHPSHIIRNHTMFNELDVCLSIYSNAITNAIERETDDGVKNTLIKHRRLTRRRMMRAIMEVYVLDRIKERAEK